jgi:hypothetical protein
VIVQCTHGRIRKCNRALEVQEQYQRHGRMPGRDTDGYTDGDRDRGSGRFRDRGRIETGTGLRQGQV